MPANGKPNGRFTLPALTPVTFSLTEGTDIPPPPDSPIEEKAPAPPPAPAAPKQVQTADNPTASQNGSAANGVYDGRGRTTTTVDHPPLSPASTTRPSSIRRFLSRKSLNTNYTNGTNHDNGSHEDILGVGRPDSPSSFLSGRPSLGKKTSGSWFSKLGGGGKRTSVVYENTSAAQQEKKVVKGPPPPKLPELNQLKAKIADDDEGSLGGGEMFKNIKGE